MSASFSLPASTFVEAFPFGFIANAEGVIQAMGSALARSIGINPTGRPLGDLIEVLRPGRCGPDRTMVLGPGRPIRILVPSLELEFRGHAFWLAAGESFAFIGTPLASNTEEIQRAGLQIKDFDPSNSTPDLLLNMQVTRTSLDDARRLSDELRAALEQAQSATAAKSRFLAVMSHEIRTPLNGFGSMLDLLMEDPSRSDADELLATMDDCARGLMTLLNDILDFSKFEEQSVRLESLDFELLPMLRAAVAPFMAQARASGLILETQLDPSTPAGLHGDPYRLRQVISNLVGNAVKFTEKGQVVVKAKSDAEHILIAIRDSGRGIPEEAQKLLFQPFSQADASTTRRFGGTGLGLTISRQLAQAMGGDLELSSTGPGGSEFLLKLPVRMGREEVKAEGVTPAAAVRGAPYKGVDVLVAEDNPTNRLVIDRLLKRLGATPHIVEDGDEAVSMLRKRSFDLVLMDMMMPVMDGLTATRWIRKLPVAWSRLPVVAFTAAAFEEDRQAALDAGMDDFLDKPVRLETLEAALARHCPPRGRAI